MILFKKEYHHLLLKCKVILIFCLKVQVKPGRSLSIDDSKLIEVKSLKVPFRNTITKALKLQK